VRELFVAKPNSVVNIGGGRGYFGFYASGDSVVNIRGREFSINGKVLDALVSNQASTITDRDVTLSGLLADGEPFSFNLNTNKHSGDGDYFNPAATLTVTLVSAVVLGDVNLDSVLDFADIPAFIAILMSGDFQAEADCNQNGALDFGDIPAFIELLLAG
jgi:hypothetical protein